MTLHQLRESAFAQKWSPFPSISYTFGTVFAQQEGRPDDRYTGTGNLTVPIALPPGRNGFKPQFNIVYSTGSGNGPFGLGVGAQRPWRQSKDFKGSPTLQFATVHMEADSYYGSFRKCYPLCLYARQVKHRGRSWMGPA
jgi:Salmonella virulence plasmid 65kDa B protein